MKIKFKPEPDYKINRTNMKFIRGILDKEELL